MKALITVTLFLLVAGATAGCVMTPEQGEQLAKDIKQVEHAIIDALPLPIPKDATKEMVGWISDFIILGGGAGAVGVGAKKWKNGDAKGKKA